MSLHFPAPNPVLDTSDLTAIANLADLETLDGEGAHDDALGAIRGDISTETFYALRARRSYRVWLNEARILAQAGIQPSPSHYSVGDRTVVSLGGGFTTAEAIQADWRMPGDPLVIFAHRIADGTELEAGLPYLPAGWPWRAITVQSAGVACHHPRFVGLVLEPTLAGLTTAYRLNGFCGLRGHRCVGVRDVTLSEARSYADVTERLGLSAEYSWHDLEEAVYPLDAEMTGVLSETPVPSGEDLYPAEAGPLRFLSGEPDAAIRSWGEFHVYVLGDNCD